MKPPFKKVLIANRGEVAVRILRACHELGIATVAIHSEVDSEALHVKLAGESVCVGPANSAESYLNMSSILSAAIVTGSEAIHPGYGFLSENSTFADICSQCGIIFIGPTVENMKIMSDKASARKRATDLNIAVIPGSADAGLDLKKAFLDAKKIGFPVLIKAAAGGGGRGMKVVEQESDFPGSFTSARAEVEAAFGDGRLYIEKFIQTPRHIEVQIIGDSHKNLIHLGERDCSMQRRYQKILEEAPSFGLPDKTVEGMRESALKLSSSINYASAGTVEFLVDMQTGNYYFIEMNTRLQVEHPVTEMVTLTDIVTEQIRVAAGASLSIAQRDVVTVGHAIETRINAEDPQTQRPSPGRVIGFHPPGGPGIRVDSALYDNYFVPPHYDSLVAKVLAMGNTRKEAINKMVVALDELIIDGINTNADLHRKILQNEKFINGDVSTKLLEEIING